MQRRHHLRLGRVLSSLLEFFEASWADDHADQNAPDVAERGKSEANEPLVPGEVLGFEERFVSSTEINETVQDFNNKNLRE